MFMATPLADLPAAICNSIRSTLSNGAWDSSLAPFFFARPARYTLRGTSFLEDTMRDNFTPMGDLLSCIEAVLEDSRDTGAQTSLRLAVEQLEMHTQKFEENAKAIARARSVYADPSDCNIEVDDDAFVAPGFEGSFVSAWVWVPHTDPNNHDDSN